MKVRCPLRRVMSLDVLIAHDDAREALIALTGISDDLFKSVLRYLTLFRPAEKDLSFNRVSKLIGEIAPMIREGEIVRNRKTYPAPREAWIWAATRCLEARDAGKLTPPLTSHGYLLENITFWSPEKTAGTAVLHSPQPLSRGRGGKHQIEERVGRFDGVVKWRRRITGLKKQSRRVL